MPSPKSFWISGRAAKSAPPRRAVLEAEADFGVPLTGGHERLSHFGVMSCVRLLLFFAIAQADVVDVFDDGNEFEAPGVEDSSLESHQTRTHDEESGSQYNFVEQAAEDQRTKGVAAGKTLSDLLTSGGAEVEVVDLTDRPASFGLADLIQQMLFAKPKPSKPKRAALPSVPPDAPVSQLLQTIRQSTHDVPLVTAQRVPPGRGREGASEAAGALSDLDSLDATGLEVLEAELLRKVPPLAASPLAAPPPAAHRSPKGATTSRLTPRSPLTAPPPAAHRGMLLHVPAQLRRVRAAKEQRAARSGEGGGSNAAADAAADAAALAAASHMRRNRVCTLYSGLESQPTRKS